MTTYNKSELLHQLTKEVNEVLRSVQQIAEQTDERTLNAVPAPGKWSLAQIVEHLNTYNRYYLAVAANKMAGGKKKNAASTFKPGWLGEYFTKSMYSDIVTAQKVTNNMKAMKGHIPDAVLNGAAVMQEFIEGQKELLQLLERAQNLDIGSVRIPITISKLIKIKLGDAFRFLVAHQVRHLLQINNTLKAVRVMVK